MTKQRINCMVTACTHHRKDNACDLGEIRIAQCDDHGKDDHESLCSNFEHQGKGGY